jgi:hypothetical protein
MLGILQVKEHMSRLEDNQSIEVYQGKTHRILMQEFDWYCFKLAQHELAVDKTYIRRVEIGQLTL